MVDLPPEIQRIARLTPLTDALACIDRLVAPVAPRKVAIDQALGLSVAGDLVIRQAHPACAIALRDGVAVAAERTLDASAYAPAVLPGAPAFVALGDALPAGTDAVAPIDMIEIRGAAVHAIAPLAPGDGVLPQGADATPGDHLAREGVRLRATGLAALAALGVTHDLHVRAPRVCITSALPNPDRIVAAIRRLLAGAVAGAGGEAVASEGTLDAPDDTAIILIGGSGSGRRDRSVADLARRGTVAFHGVGLAPGETAAFGTIGARPVLIVPGRLDAALAVWLTLGRRMVARLAGHDDTEPTMPVTLTRKIASTLGLAEIVPVARENDGVVPLASGYLPLQALAQADGYVLVPADSEGFPAGAAVAMRPLP